MLHPHTELRFVSKEIGYGIYATQDIPKGTITWVKDELDRVFTLKEVDSLTPPNYENLMKYTYRDRKGNFFFCWDLTRFVNHSYEPNSMLTALGFEVAIKDIGIGEEVTNDYGTLNIIEAFKCANGPSHEREFVKPDDLLRFHKKWDLDISLVIPFMGKVDQPLNSFLSLEQSESIESIKSGSMKMPSVIDNYFNP